MPRLIAFLLLFGVVFAQFDFDPSKRWFTITTQHFDIHYHTGLETVASEAAIYAEEAYTVLVNEYGSAPSRIQLVLSDQGDYTNGFSNPTTNTVGIFASQLRGADGFNPRLGSWWQTVIFHEIVHAIDLTQRRDSSLNGLLGQLPASNAIKPYPFVEGLAVYMKYKKLGESRLNDSNTRMYIRQMVLDNKFPSLDEIRQAYSRTTWPGLGFLVYNYSAWLNLYLETRFGPEAIRRFTDANASQPTIKDFNWPFQQAFGVSLDAIYADFVKWLPSQFEAEIARIRSEGLTEASKITSLGYISKAPSDGSKGILYSHRSPIRSGIRLKVNDSERELVGGVGEYPQWSPDGRYVIFTTSRDTDAYTLISDLYQTDTLTGETKRLTSDARIAYARYAPDGRSIYATRSSVNGSTDLVRYFPDQNQTQLLRPFPNQDGLIHSFAVAPDGKSLVLSLLRRGGFQDLYLYEPDLGKLTALTQNRDIEADPVFSPDGKFVIYSADVNRVYNLYAMRLEDKAVFQVTNLLTGAFSPTISFSKQQIIFSGYDASGYNLYQIPYNPNTWKPVQIGREERPEYKPVEAAKGEPYNSFNYLRPPFFLPTIVSTEAGFGIGVSFSGSDPIGTQSYSVTAGVDSLLRGVFYDLGYINNALGTPIGLRLLGENLQNAQAIGTSLWNPSGATNLQYTRLDVSSQPATTHSFSVASTSVSGSIDDLFRARTLVNVAASAFVRENDWQWRYRVQGAVGVSLRLPLESTHTFSIKLAGGLTSSPLSVDAFDLGLDWYTSATPALAVRGFGIGQLKGAQAVVGSLEYRLPAWNIERGLGNWPLFFDDLGLTLFVDAGVAGSPIDWNQIRYSVGAELRMSLTLAYLASGTNLGIGIAQGIGEAGPRVYAILSLPVLP